MRTLFLSRSLPVFVVFAILAGGMVPLLSATPSRDIEISTDLDSPGRPDKFVIRTTAYTHTESDHLPYGNKAAAGNTLRCGSVNSAAADWSRIPLGTKFKIEDSEAIYIIDDYGSALIGKDVIDVYKPTRSAMNKWGAREVEIEVIEWGCFERSLEILKPRAAAAPHVQEMVKNLESQNTDTVSESA